MNKYDQVLRQGLEKLIDISSGEITYISASVPVHATVHRSYSQYDNSSPESNGYMRMDNTYVLARTEEVNTWGLIPQVSEIDLDGATYILGTSIVKNNAYWQIYLRLPQ